MKILNAATLLSGMFLFLSFTLNAQTSSEEDSMRYKMSTEKADSLLLDLFKSKSKKKEVPVAPEAFSAEVSPMPVRTGAESLFLSVDQLFSGTGSLSLHEDYLFPYTDTVVVVETEIDTEIDTTTVIVDRHRKKVHIDRSDFLIGQEVHMNPLKEEADFSFGTRRSVNEGTLIGIGGYKMRDRYLSQVDYGGLGFRYLNERMRLLKTAENRISRQNIVNVDVSSALNSAENANFLSAFVDYSVGYHYRLLPDPFFKIMLGMSARGLLGMVYNTRNGNNPMTIHADIDLNFSLIAIYEFRIKQHPVAIRYQFETPFAGMLFSPIYDQSYYEIFSLGNTAETFNFNSFHNKFAMRNYVTLDFPLGNMTVRTGYLGSYYSTDVHKIDRYVISHNFMLGFVKEFVLFGGREMRKRNLSQSAYY